MIDLEKIKTRVFEGVPIEDVLSKLDWKEFEEAVAEIFLENGFNVKRNMRINEGKRYEIDLVASEAKGSRKIFCIDCKEWNRGRSKKSGIKLAAAMQKERTQQFEKFVSKNFIARDYVKLPGKAEFCPMLVTLFEEDLKEEDGVFVVPVWKLNSFLNEDL